MLTKRERHMFLFAAAYILAAATLPLAWLVIAKICLIGWFVLDTLLAVLLRQNTRATIKAVTGHPATKNAELLDWARDYIKKNDWMQIPILELVCEKCNLTTQGSECNICGSSPVATPVKHETS